MTDSTSTPQRLYTPGGPVQVGGGVYIERRADGELLEHCRAGEYVYVLSTRQVGKSSLMYHTARQLRAEGFAAAIVDLSRPGAETTAEQWYLGLLTRIAQRLVPDFDVLAWWHTNAHFGETERFARFFTEVLLLRVDKRIVVFIDEIDTTLSLKFSDDFFATIRALHSERVETPALNRLSFVLIGVANPNDLINDPRRTPFNIAFPVELTDFTFEEALPLADGFGLPDHEARQTLRWALDWTGGHPFLTQRLCRAIAGAGRDRWTESDINELVNEVFLKEAEKDSNLRAVRDLLLERAPDKDAVLRVYRDVLRGKRVTDEERSPIKSHLKLAGVVRPNNRNLLTSRNRVYQCAFDLNWVKEHLPVDWQERFKTMRYAAAALLALLLVTTTSLSIYALTLASRERIAAGNEREARNLAEQKRKEAEAAAENAKQAAERALISEALAVEANERADKQRIKAEQIASAEKIARKRADEQSKIATSRELASYARSAMLTEPELSFQLAAKAVNFAPTNQAVETLREALPQTFLQAELRGHTGIVNSAQFSPDGQCVLTSSNDHTARVWKVATGKLIQELKGHTDGVDSAQFSPDGQRVLTSSVFDEARIWQAATGKLIAELKDTDGVNSAQFSPDGQRVLTSSFSGAARIWQAATGEIIAELKDTDGVNSAQFSPDGQRVLTASSDGTARVWQAATGEIIATLKGYIERMDSAQFSPDGQRVVTVSSDGTASVWQAATGEIIADLKRHPYGVKSAQFSPDGQSVVTTSLDSTARVWQAATGELIAELMGHTNRVNSAQFSPDGQRVVTTSLDNTARVWQVSKNQHITVLKRHSSTVNSAQFSADGQRIVTASADFTACVWEAATGKPILDLGGQPGPLASAQFSPDGQYVVTIGLDSTARVWKAATGKLIRELKGPTNTVKYGQTSISTTRVIVNSAQFSPDGQRVITASSDRTARVWEVATGKLIQELKGHTDTVISAQFSQDGQRVVTASSDRTARVWEVATGKLIQELKGHTDTVKSAQTARRHRQL